MKKNRLLINWKPQTDSGFPIYQPHQESFFTKSMDSAKAIIDRRSKQNIESAYFEGTKII